MPLSSLGTLGVWLGHWAVGNSYALLFVAMLIEGPAITAAGAFAAALGFFDLWAIFLLSVFANFIPDLIFYSIGFWGRRGLVDRYGHYFGVSKERIALAETIIEKHSGKSLIAIKMIPFIAMPGLVMAGAAKMKFRKFITWSAAITVPSSLLYLILGYYFGAAYHSVIHYLNISLLVIVAGIVVFLIIIYLEKRFSRRIVEKIQKEQ